MIAFHQTVSGKLIRRYKRFLMDVERDTGEIITAHCANSGSMMDVCAAGLPIVLSYNPGPKRTYAHTAEMVYVDETWVGINTQHPNRLIRDALIQGALPEISGYTSIKPEATIGDSRLDFFLESWGYVEVKNAHLKRHPWRLEFPDSVTARGTKHLKELTKIAQTDNRAALIYVGQRSDIHHFQVAKDLDPAYADAYAAAKDAGVMMLAYTCTVMPEGIGLNASIPCL